MFKSLMASSFAQNMVSDAITHGAVFGGGILAAAGFFPHCSQGQIAAGQCSDYQAYLGSAIFLAGLVWKWFENRSQSNTKTALTTQVVQSGQTPAK